MIKWLKWMIDHTNTSTHKEHNRDESLRWLFSFIRPQRKAIILVLLLSVLASAMVLLQPWLTKQLIDEGLLAKDYAMLLQVSVWMVVIGLVNTGLSGFNRYYHTRLSGKILFALREDLYQHLQKLSPNFYAQRRIGDLMSRMDGDVAQIQRFAVDALFSSVSSVLGLVGAISMMLWLSWQLSLLVLILIPLEVLWLRWMRRKVERHARNLRERSADLSSFLVETLPAMKFIQSVAQEPREARRLQQFGGQYLNQLLTLQWVEFFTHAIPSTLTSLARAGIFLVGGYWVIEGQWQLGALIAFSTYLGMALGPVQSLLGLYVAIQKMVVSLDRVAELRQQPFQVDARIDAVALPEKSAGVITLNQVSFCHQDRTDPVLNQVSLVINAGLKVAISGPSGVGKSTLIDLLQRHYDPTQGHILFDGVDIRYCTISSLRRAIAVVSQDIILFRGSVLDNIRYACPTATDEQVKAAAIQAQLGELIATLPLGLDTPLGERGQQLSGGQKQRIAIARALLQQPRVLVLDEATSAVDEKTEQEIITTVDQLFVGRTRILISHRQSTLQNADLYLQFNHGRLIDTTAEVRASIPPSQSRLTK